jgi:ribonuclease HI
MNDAMSAFWWGDSEEQKKLHWFSWWKMCVPKKSGGMGFRDLYAFNLAMLSKQVWRLINNPGSLCAQVLRAKYYPDGNILKAGPKKGSSYTWQSIVAGLQTFRRGHILRVGSGTTINIWEDHWIPNSYTRKVLSSKGQSLLRTVDELISPVTGTWDEELIRENLLQIDAERILKIPLSEHLTDDFVAWHNTKSHSFTVRSAYYTEWNHQFGNRMRRPDGQGNTSCNPVWEKVWKLEVPSKIKIFMWRALHGVVPGKSILADRHMRVHPQCPVCQAGPEDMRHLLFTCLRAREVWKSLGLSDYIDQALIGERSGSCVLEEILRRSNQNTPILGMLKIKETIAVACWYVWWQRREMVKGETVSEPFRTAFAIQAITANYVSASSANPIEREHTWKKPAKGEYKLNIDASFRENGRGSSGAVLRNDRGEAIAGYAGPLNHVFNAATAEALALLKGLEFLEQLGVSSVNIESDSLELIQACKSEIEIWSPYTAVLADCFLKAHSFKDISFEHCRREANQVAHQLAKFSFESNSVVSWDDAPPSFIIPFVLDDVTMLASK